MRILALECSSVSASVAVTEDMNIIGSDFVRSGLTHSQTLMPMLENVLKANNIPINSIDVFCCTAGPGSFTGVRIGVAAIKGLADAQDKPCFSVSSLEAAAYPFKDFDGAVCAVMDARCKQVYTASFLNGERISPDEAIMIDELYERLLKLNKPVLLTGDGAELVYNELSGKINDLSYAEANSKYAKASSAALIAYEKIINGESLIPSEQLLPVYLRVPQAQRELNRKNKLKGE